MSAECFPSSAPCVRSAFWCAAQPLISPSAQDWESRFAALADLVAAYGGSALIAAPPPRDAGEDHQNGLGGPRGAEVSGPRGFLKRWSRGEVTGIHGHPSVLYVHVLSGCLEVEEYERVGATGVRRTRAYRLALGQTCTGAVDNDRADNFVHRIRCIDDGWSLHLYSDAPGRGMRFSDPVDG